MKDKILNNKNKATSVNKFPCKIYRKAIVSPNKIIKSKIKILLIKMKEIYLKGKKHKK